MIVWIPFLMMSAVSKKWQVSDSRAVVGAQNCGLDIPAFYINLHHREDRNQETLAELRSLGLTNFSRLEATANSPGALGCAQSHLSALERAREAGGPVTLILEDDIEFVAKGNLFELILSDFMRRPGLGVLCLAYRLRGPYFPISRNLALANNIQTTAGYAVKEFAIPALERSFRSSKDLLANGIATSVASIDVRWKSVQFNEVLFCIPQAPIARQRMSYSDIARKVKFYGD